MAVPRVLLLTPAPPGDSSVGSIFLRNLCRHYPRGSLCCFSTCLPCCTPLPDDLAWMPIAYGRAPRTYGLRRLGHRFAQLSCFPVVQYARFVQMPALVEQAVHFGRQHHVELVWAVLETHTCIYMARQVSARLGTPLVTTVWDPPEGEWSRGVNYDHLSLRLLLHDFEDAIRASAKCGVMSEAMQAEYKKRYGCDSVVMVQSIHPRLRRPPARAPNSDEQFIIGFAGSLYTYRHTWEAFSSALSSVDWLIEGRRVIVRLLTSHAPLRAQGKMHIEYLGWRSVGEAIELISQVDIAYLPYLFDDRNKVAVRLCFPGKMSTYLAAGRPVLYHGPEDSSPTRFFQRFPVGLCCHSLSEVEIIDSLRRFILDRALYISAVKAGQDALDQELGLHILLQRFAELMGIAHDELIPLNSV